MGAIPWRFKSSSGHSEQVFYSFSGAEFCATSYDDDGWVIDTFAHTQLRGVVPISIQNSHVMVDVIQISRLS